MILDEINNNVNMYLINTDFDSEIFIMGLL